jgi:hypothetical protein
MGVGGGNRDGVRVGSRDGIGEEGVVARRWWNSGGVGVGAGAAGAAAYRRWSSSGIRVGSSGSAAGAMAHCWRGSSAVGGGRCGAAPSNPEW